MIEKKSVRCTCGKILAYTYGKNALDVKIHRVTNITKVHGVDSDHSVVEIKCPRCDMFVEVVV